MKVAIISSASFQKINFAKLIPQNTTKVISSVPEHLNQSIVQYAIEFALLQKIWQNVKIKGKQ